MGLRICTSCKHSTNNWGSTQWHCKANVVQSWSWVLGKGEVFLGKCEQWNHDGKCEDFERKRSWLQRIFSKK